MGKRAASKTPKEPKKPSPSKEPGGKKDESPKATRSSVGFGEFNYKASGPMKMGTFARAQGFARTINIDAGSTVDIDTSAQPKSVTEVVNIGPRSCVNVMSSGETQTIAQTINIGGESVVNIAVDAKIQTVAETINITAGSTINLVTAPTDRRCYHGHLNDRQEVVRQWAATIAASGMVQERAAPAAQETTTSTGAVQEISAAHASGTGIECPQGDDEAGCEAQ